MGAVVVNCLSSEKETSCHFFLVNFRPQKGSSIKNGDSKSCTISSRPETSGRSSRHYENQCGKSDGTRWKTRRFESTSRRFRSWNSTIQNGRQQNSTQAFLGKHEDENHNWCCHFSHHHYHYNCCIIWVIDLGESFLGIHPKCDPNESNCFFTITTTKESTFFSYDLPNESMFLLLHTFLDVLSNCHQYILAKY